MNGLSYGYIKIIPIYFKKYLTYNLLSFNMYMQFKVIL